MQTKFNDALNEIENGNDTPLTQKEYDEEMNKFMKTLQNVITYISKDSKARAFNFKNQLEKLV